MHLSNDFSNTHCVNCSGGAKVWECTETMGDYLTRADGSRCLIDEFRGKTVLDLGCGAGILGKCI